MINFSYERKIPDDDDDKNNYYSKPIDLSQINLVNMF